MTAGEASATSCAQAGPLLEVQGLGKSFGSIPVLKGVSFGIHAGEVLALMGANGAGKSTLMNIVSGVLAPDEGTLRIDALRSSFTSPAQAHAAGIAMVHQELHLVPELSIAENIFLGREPLNRFRWLDRRRLNAQARAILQRLSASLEPAAQVRDLRVAEQQLVEIAKALSHSARLLILDEPTAALSEVDAHNLLRTVQSLQREGVALIYTSHRLEEVFEIATRVLVLRDGRVVSDRPVNEVTRPMLIRDMAGRDIVGISRPDRAPMGQPLTVQPLISVSALARSGSQHAPMLQNITFDVHRGEVFGIAGLMGTGRTQLLEILAGACTDPWAGHMRIEGQAYRPRSPAEAIAAGVAFVTEDRKDSGLVLSHSIRANIALASLPRLSRIGCMREGIERTQSQEALRRLRIRAMDSEQNVAHLSGGNQQKVVIAKWLAIRPRLLLLDEPTRGIDVDAKASFYELLHQLTEEGLGVVLVSSDWLELMSLADRILVLQTGRPAALLLRGEFSPERLLEHASPGGAIQPAYRETPAVRAATRCA